MIGAMLWDVMLHNLVQFYKRFKGTCRLYLQAQTMNQASNQQESRQQVCNAVGENQHRKIVNDFT
jgi:hypothetical protein